MPWRETWLMDQRGQFIADYQRDVFDVADLARRYGIRRKTAYKWLDRYETGGPGGLVDRSRRPAHSPQETSAPIVAALIEVRRHHPTWGAKKLLKMVATRQPTWTLPARITVCDLLDRAGLITTSRRRSVPAHPGRPLIPMTAPNGTWTADFKGQFKTRNGVYCYPLTVVDGFSRYLLACQGLVSTEIALARPIFLRLFQEYGLPWIIRTDNGVPFATTALGRLSTLSVWWIRLGHSARTDRTGLTAAERSARAHASDAQSRGHAPPQRESPGATSPLQSVSSRVQQRSSARSLRPRDPRVALSPVGARPATAARAPRIPRTL